MADKTEFLAGIDRASLVLAVVAGSVTFTMDDGAWTGFTSFVGFLLLCMVLAFHRPVVQGTRLRRGLGKLAFGLTTALTLSIALAMPVQKLSGLDVVSDRLLLLSAFVGMAVACLEPQIAKLLDGVESVDSAGTW